MPDCGQGRRRRAVRLVRSGCARQARNYSIFICFELNGRANDERQAVIIRINGCFEQRLFTPGADSHTKRSPSSTPIKGLVIANQNGKSSLSRARILMLMRFLLLVRYAGGFHNVRKSAPDPLPSSCRRRIRSEI